MPAGSVETSAPGKSPVSISPERVLGITTDGNLVGADPAVSGGGQRAAVVSSVARIDESLEDAMGLGGRTPGPVRLAKRTLVVYPPECQLHM